jgi:hypothetical protein
MALGGGQGSQLTGATDSGVTAQTNTINAGGFGLGFFERQEQGDSRRDLMLAGAALVGLVVLALVLRRG